MLGNKLGPSRQIYICVSKCDSRLRAGGTQRNTPELALQNCHCIRGTVLDLKVGGAVTFGWISIGTQCLSDVHKGGPGAVAPPSWLNC